MSTGVCASIYDIPAVVLPIPQLITLPYTRVHAEPIILHHSKFIIYLIATLFDQVDINNGNI